jgi:hypothetical protein
MPNDGVGCVCVGDRLRLAERSLVADLGRQPVGPFQVGHGSLVVTPDELVKAADPEQSLGLPAGVAQRSVQLQGAFEQRQLGGILGGRGTRVAGRARGEDAALAVSWRRWTAVIQRARR